MEYQPPIEGERVLFCRHANIDTHAGIDTMRGLMGNYHWYHLGGVGGEGVIARRRQSLLPGISAIEPVRVRWLCICTHCHRLVLSGEPPIKMAAKDAAWAGSSPDIIKQRPN